MVLTLKKDKTYDKNNGYIIMAEQFCQRCPVKTLFCFFQSLKPNVFSALAQIHAGEVIPMAHFGANFPGWHRIFMLM